MDYITINNQHYIVYDKYNYMGVWFYQIKYNSYDIFVDEILSYFEKGMRITICGVNDTIENVDIYNNRITCKDIEFHVNAVSSEERKNIKRQFNILNILK